MKKIGAFLNLIRDHVRPRHFFETLDELATTKITEKVHNDAAYVTRDIEHFWRFTAAEVDQSLGEYYEFGVFQGTSINFFARELGRNIHGFDSFEGLPAGEGVWKKYRDEGTFDRGGQLPTVEDNVTLHQGWISDTLPRFIEERDLQQAAFIHIDTDIYESAACILDNLGPYIDQGTVILFDELCNYEGFYLHEYQAFIRFLKQRSLSYEILAVCSVGTRHDNFLKVATRIANP